MCKLCPAFENFGKFGIFECNAGVAQLVERQLLPKWPASEASSCHFENPDDLCRDQTVSGPYLNAGVAQLVERQLPKLNVASSNLVTRSTPNIIVGYSALDIHHSPRRIVPHHPNNPNIYNRLPSYYGIALRSRNDDCTNMRDSQNDNGVSNRHSAHS